MDQIQTAESLALQARVKLLQELLDALRGEREHLEFVIPYIESAAHILNSLDPARAGFLTGSYATLKAEQTTP